MHRRCRPCRLTGMAPHRDPPVTSDSDSPSRWVKRAYGTGSIRRRGPATWQLRVRIPGSDGGPSRQVAKTVHGDRDDADRALARFLVTAEVDAERRRTAGATLDEVVAGYLKWCESENRAPNTIYGYRREWAKVCDDLGSMQVGKISRAKAKEYFSRRRKEGMPGSTINAILRVLRAACNWAVGNELIPRHPFGDVELVETRKKRTTAPSDDQVAVVFERALTDDPVIAAAIRVGAVLGSRRGEIPAMRWSGVDLERARVRRGEAASAPPRPSDEHGNLIGKAQVVVRQTKTGADDWHPVDAHTVDVLRRHREACEKQAAEFGLELDDEAYVFSADPEGARPMRPDSLTRRVKEIAEKVPGAEMVRPKHLRKWTATVLANEVPVAVAQADSITPTQRRPSGTT